MAPAPMIRGRTVAVGDVFVNHRIEGLAGRGGMGVVYRATDLELDRLVALKVISPALAEHADFRSRFVAESKAAASIEHPHVIPVYYAGQREGVLFIVMRYVAGPDLRALVRVYGRLEPERAVRIVAQLGDALDAAHARGLVHRDVKPANVLLDADDHAYLTDFGLTKRAASAGLPTSAGGWAGTPAYLAPEQIRGDGVDARADVYALGCVLVHALTGADPFVRDCDEATLRAHLSDPPPVAGVPRELAAVVGRAMAKDPGERFASAGELGRAALDALGALPRSARIVVRRAPQPPSPRASAPPHLGETHPSPSSDVPRRVERWRAVALGAALIALGGLAFGQVGQVGDRVRAGTALAEPPATHAAARPVPVGERPDVVAIAGGRAWVLSSAVGELHVLDAVTGRRQARIDVGASLAGAGMAAGFGAVWVVKASTRSLIQIGAGAGHRHLDTKIPLDVTGAPDRVAVGDEDVWVATRDSGGGTETIVKVDPLTYAQQHISVPAGTRQIAAGPGGLWVTNGRMRTVTRIDAADPLNRRTISLGVAPDAIAVSPRAVWIVSGSAVLRINPATGERRRVVLDARPTRIAVGGGAVWAIAGAGRRLIRIDPVTLRVRDTIAIAGGADALAVSGGRVVWLALYDRSSAQRIVVKSPT